MHTAWSSLDAANIHYEYVPKKGQPIHFLLNCNANNRYMNIRVQSVLMQRTWVRFRWLILLLQVR